MDHRGVVRREISMTKRTNRSPRLLLGVVVVALLAIIAATTVAAAQISNVAVTPQSFAPGDAITVSGDGCGPDDADFVDHVAIATLVQVATGTAYGSAQTPPSATGSWSTQLITTGSAPNGDYEVRTVCRAKSTSSGVPVGLSGPSVAVTVARPSNAPTMSVSPTQGTRPLTVTVTGSSCGLATAIPRIIRVELLDPSLQQVEVIELPDPSADWSTTFVIETPRINPYTVRAVCLTTPGGSLEASFPDQRVQVSPPAPVLAISPAALTAPGTIVATADRCPDPELPRLGGGYGVAFEFEPAGQTFDVVPNGDSFVAAFEVPAGTPPGTYTVTATCTLEELGFVSTIFTYDAATYVVQAAPVTPTVVATTVPYPDIEPTTTPTAQPTPPTPTSTPAPSSGDSGSISFTG